MLNNEISLDEKLKINACAINWLDVRRSSKYWNLTIEQVVVLLGGVSEDCYKAWVIQATKTGKLQLHQDVEERLSLLLGIHKSISQSSPVGRESDFWNTGVKHPIFQGKSIKTKLIESPTISTFIEVKQYLESKY